MALTSNHRGTSRAPAPSTYAVDDTEDVNLETEEGDSEQMFGSNDGEVKNPYLWIMKTHAPRGGQEGREKKIHLLVHLLSATNAKTGYTVGLKPKAKEICIRQCIGIEHILWGEAARGILPSADVKDEFEKECAKATVNFTEIPNQMQRVEFPFALLSVERKKPFYVALDTNPNGTFCGLYIRIKVDWVDTVRESAGDDYTQLRSPVKPGSFYSNYPTATATATPTTSNTSQAEEIAMLKMLLGRFGVSGAVPVDRFPGACVAEANIVRPAWPTPKHIPSPPRKPQSTSRRSDRKPSAEKDPIPGGTKLFGSMFDSVKKGIFSPSMNTLPTETTPSDPEDSDVSFGDDNSDIETLYQEK